MNNNRGKTIIVQGGQYGSEGKGQIAAFLAGQPNVRAAVRTGSINAGHTVYYKGRKFSMQIIPTAWVHPHVKLMLGAGCYIEPSILKRECDMVSEALGEDIRERLVIDHRCAWFGTAELERAQEANRHHAMGATGKGASEGIITKMRDRGAEDPAARLFIRHGDANSQYYFLDTALLLHRVLCAGHDVVLEGTQGALLDFNLGPYPYVTTRMTNAAAWLAECGLPPVNVETVLVLRSFPIRVAGNSGPMPGETSWPALARMLNAQSRSIGRLPDVPEEAIAAFESALAKVMAADFPEAVAELGFRAVHQYTWSPEERVRHRVALSEANARALALLPEETLRLLKFFERTTVTKKLRRVAAFDTGEALRAIQMNAPTSIAYTFLNYEIPQLTGETNLLTIDNLAGKMIRDLESQLHVPIRYVTTEREQHHVIDLNS